MSKNRRWQIPLVLYFGRDGWLIILPFIGAFTNHPELITNGSPYDENARFYMHLGITRIAIMFGRLAIRVDVLELLGLRVQRAVQSIEPEFVVHGKFGDWRFQRVRIMDFTYRGKIQRLETAYVILEKPANITGVSDCPFFDDTKNMENLVRDAERATVLKHCLEGLFNPTIE